MDTNKIKIVADSGSDIRSMEDVAFSSAPLKIITSVKEYVDSPDLDVAEMVNDLKSYNGRSTTSCPNPEDWLSAFGDAEWVFCLTITATLSGSYNSAMLAKKQYEEAHEGRRVLVFNSLSTGPEMVLLSEKIKENILLGKDFDTISAELDEYAKTTGLVFVLESLKNLANNGRVSKIVANMAGILGIRLVAKASDKGDVEPINKVRGEHKSLEAVVDYLIENGLKTGKAKIGHCVNQAAADTLKALIGEKIPAASVEIYPLGGLCSFYAEKGGLIIGYEKF